MPQVEVHDDRSHRTRRRVLAVGVAVSVLVIAPALLLYGSYVVRDTMDGGSAPVCVVTAESLAEPNNVYDGGDHPLDPEVGEQYRGFSGCYVGEVQCRKTIEIFGSRVDC